MSSTSKISIVIPVKNEIRNVQPLTKEISDTCFSLNYEIIFINDGSTDGTEAKLINLKHKYDNLRVITHNKSFGQSFAIKTGVLHAQYDIIVTMDGDCQNDPADIPSMIKKYEKENNKLLFIGGVRKERKDNLPKRLASRFGRYCRIVFLKDNHPDSGCGIKLFHKSLFLSMPYFDHMHRFLPALAKREGAKVIAVNVNHRKRLEGASNYTNLGRLLVGIFDILGVMWLIKRSPKNFNSKEKK